MALLLCVNAIAKPAAEEYDINFVASKISPSFWDKMYNGGAYCDWYIVLTGDKALHLDFKVDAKETFAGSYTLEDCLGPTKYDGVGFSSLSMTIEGQPKEGECVIQGTGVLTDGRSIAFSYGVKNQEPQTFELEGNFSEMPNYHDGAWHFTLNNVDFELYFVLQVEQGQLSGYYTLADCDYNGTLFHIKGSNNYTPFAEIKFEITGQLNHGLEITGEGTLYSDDVVKFHHSDQGEDFSIGASGYASFFSSYKSVIVPAHTEAYVAYLSGGNFVFEKAYEAGDVVPAGTGVVFKAEEPGTVGLIYGEGGVAPAHNDLHGTDDQAFPSLTGDYYYYALTRNKDHDNASVGFYWMDANGGRFVNDAHKAYLALPKSAGARSGYALDGEATGISAVEASMADAPAFNMAGQRVNAKNGLVIRNGKAVFVK